MSRIFSCHVARLNTSGELHQFKPGDAVPEWLHDLVDDQAATDGTAQVVEDDPVEDQGAESVQESDTDSDDDDGQAPVPEKSWKKDDLIDWAEAHDVDLDDASTKDDIWEIIDAYLEN
jgi:hypothetical protein